MDNSQVEISDPGTSCTVAAQTPAPRAQNPGTSCTLTTLNNPDTDTRERAAKFPDPVLVEVLATCGVPADEAQRLHGQTEPNRWRDELGLDQRTILAVLHRVLMNARRGDPHFLPTSLAYFTEEMRREAGRRLKPALTPING